jgi:uncharacterized protein YutE (UPF0331/DUF86 family)
MMEEDRKKRFFQKLETLEDRLTFIEDNFAGIEDLKENRILRKALYKEFQELAESLGDLSAMMIKAEGKLVKDDYTNLDGLHSYLDPGTIKDLKKANGLRNVLVHDYNGIIDELAFESMKDVLPSFWTFGSVVREWLQKQ